MAELFVALTAIGTKIATAASTVGWGTIASGLGTALSAGGTIYAGAKANQSAQAQADSMEAKGEQELAISQRKAAESRREKRLALSRQLAVAAASGGGATDPTTESIMAQTEEKGEYNALLDMYNGRSMRADLYNEAGTARAEGKSQLVGSVINAGSTIYDGFSKRRRSTAEYSML